MSEEDSPSSSTDEVIHPKVSSTAVKHIYFDEEHDDNETSPTYKTIEHPISSTIRVDGSDLISRCKDFIPLLSDTNPTSSNKDKSDDDDDLILPDDSLSEKSAKESGEASSTTDEEMTKKKRKKKKKKKKKKLKPNDNLNQDVNVNNQDILPK